jgi:chromate transporter
MPGDRLGGPGSFTARYPDRVDESAQQQPAPVVDPAKPESTAGIFLLFLAFGARAFGGPLVQIAALEEQFVERRRWTSAERFRRALGVYQVLPGPEAHEMCCYLGTVRGGRVGGLAAGLGFMLPGLVLMLVASALYAQIDLSAPAVAGALMAMQLAACALIVRAVWRLMRPLAADWRLAIAIAAAVAVLFFRILAPAPAAAETDIALQAPGVGALFGHGLTAGLVTFGGAYTALPYVAATAAGEGGWMTQQACLDGVAIASVLPAPLVIFGTFVGYAGSGIAGALAFTAGIFLPAFGFTFLGFGLFERLVAWKPARRTLDLLGAAAVGLIAGAAILFMIETSGGWPKRPVFFGGWTAPLIGLAIGIVFRVRHPLVAPILVIGAGAAGAIAGALFA